MILIFSVENVPLTSGVTVTLLICFELLFCNMQALLLDPSAQDQLSFQNRDVIDVQRYLLVLCETNDPKQRENG